MILPKITMIKEIINNGPNKEDVTSLEIVVATLDKYSFKKLKTIFVL